MREHTGEGETRDYPRFGKQQRVITHPHGDRSAQWEGLRGIVIDHVAGKNYVMIDDPFAGRGSILNLADDELAADCYGKTCTCGIGPWNDQGVCDHCGGTDVGMPVPLVPRQLEVEDDELVSRLRRAEEDIAFVRRQITTNE